MERRLSIVGGGRVGRALGRRLHALGWKIEVVAALSETSARRAVRFIGAGKACAGLTRQIVASRVMLIAVPDQAIVDGVLKLQVIEGTLSRINVEGNYWFRSSYFTSRLLRDAGPPVNVNALQERLQLFQTDPRIERINAELRPGETRGESALNVRVAERACNIQGSRHHSVARFGPPGS